MYPLTRSAFVVSADVDLNICVHSPLCLFSLLVVRMTHNTEEQREFLVKTRYHNKCGANSI